MIIVYGTHTATTLIPILSEIAYSDVLTFSEKNILISFYLPYFIIPAILTIYFVFHTDPFRNTKSSKIS